MLNLYGLTTSAIQSAFADVVRAEGGTVTDCFDDGERLFARSVLPGVTEVLPKDLHQRGVALRATSTEIWVHPYAFRQLCSNGAILARTLQTVHLDDVGTLEPDEALEAVREAVRACSTAEAFVPVAERMREASRAQADLALTLIPFLSRLNLRGSSNILTRILERFFEDRDTTRFGLMNAVTSVARDTRDPEVRWRLEELGGDVAWLEGPQQERGEGASGHRDRVLVASA
jgi:hypothetical protein